MPVNLEDLFNETKTIPVEITSKAGKSYQINVTYKPIEVTPAIVMKTMSLSKARDHIQAATTVQETADIVEELITDAATILHRIVFDHDMFKSPEEKWNLTSIEDWKNVPEWIAFPILLAITGDTQGEAETPAT